MKITEDQLNTFAKLIVTKILGNNGLARSTFNDFYPEAYEELLRYRADMEEAVKRVIKKVNL